MDLVSIITINFNDSIGLQKTIKSVVNQSYAQIEFIIIDGGSTDESKFIIEQNNSKIKYWVSEKDNGRYHAMNKGILKATGNYCLFLNSGDYLVNNDVVSNVFFNIRDSDIVYGNMQIDWGNGNIQSGKMPNKITFDHMYIDTLWHPISFIKRNLFEKFGNYNEAYKIVADYDFFFKVIVMSNVSLEYVDVDISVYNVNGLSSLPDNKLLEKMEREKVHKSYLPQSIIEFTNEKLIPKKTNNRMLFRLRNFLKGI
jgi:glycosyltransferase involved in cell wall biosynthesis